MTVHEIRGARVFYVDQQQVTLIGHDLYCTCPDHLCVHERAVWDRLGVDLVAERHRLERLMVENAIRVLPDVPRQTA